MTKSRVLSKLRAGELVRIFAVTRVVDPWLAEVAGKVGFDLVWLDMEHRAFGYDVIDPLSLACRAARVDLMVRILKTGYSAPMRVLEFGANGIMVPHCRSADEARQWVEWCRFPPLGKRGFDGSGADADFMLANPFEYLRQANEETFLVLQIEDREAIECIDEIAAVPGVDVLFVGPGDLSLSYGAPFQLDHPTMQRALDRVAKAVAKAGKWWGLATGTPAPASLAVRQGARFLTCGSDHAFLVKGLQNAYEEYRQITVS